MNSRKLQLELMRAILKSSSLQYDDAYPIVVSLAQQISSVVLRREKEIVLKREKELEARKIEEQRKRDESQKVSERSIRDQPKAD